MFNLHKNHKMLVFISFTVYLALSTLVSIYPASQLQDVQPLPTAQPMTDMELEGLAVYVAEGCIACHTQQVRNIEMDEMWGKRPSIPSDYYYDKQRPGIWRNTPSLLGSERTGPDLTNIGNRQPNKTWQLIHLYNPRAVVPESIMPSYAWLFEIKDSTQLDGDDVVVPVPKKYFNQPGRKVVAKPRALELVAYLIGLKQAPMPGEKLLIDFIPAPKVASSGGGGGGGTAEGAGTKLDGEKLYIQYCSTCHMKTGEGLAGAYPPLKGSPVVNDDDPTLQIKIILEGYDARTEYAVMAPFKDILSDEQIAAIINHERTSWGNDAKLVTVDKVKKVRDFINLVGSSQ